MQAIVESSKYSDNSRFEEIANIARECLSNDANNWLKFKDQAVDLKDYESHDGDDFNWFVLHIFNTDPDDVENQIPEFVNTQFEPLIEELKTLKGCDRALLNFIGPKSIIPEHVDSEEVPAYTDTGTYNIVVGIFRESGKLEDVALKVEDIVLPTEVGKAHIFNCQVPHSGWNNSNEWRVTLLLLVQEAALS